MVVLLVMTGCRLFPILMVLGKKDVCFEYMCAGIGQGVVLSISSGWCMMCLAERRCTVLSLWMLEAVCGSRMLLAYSKMGRTGVV